MSKVKGENVIVYFYDSGIWKMYACAVGCSLSVNTDTIETSEVGAGKYATYRPTKNSFEGSLNGIVNLGTANTLSLSDLRAKQLTHTKLLMRFTRTADNGNVYTDEGYFYIIKSSDDGSIDSNNTFNIEIKGTGTLTTIFTPTPTTTTGTIVKTYYYQGIGGEYSFTEPLLINKDIVGAFKDGPNFKVIITGTPINKEVLYDISTGTFTFSVPFDLPDLANDLYDGATIQYQDL